MQTPFVYLIFLTSLVFFPRNPCHSLCVKDPDLHDAKASCVAVPSLSRSDRDVWEITLEDEKKKASATDLDFKIRSFIHQTSERALNYGAGILFGSVSMIARLGWAMSLMTPFASTVGNECLLISHTCGTFARQLFTQSFSPYLSPIPSSHLSWYTNRNELSQIPTNSREDRQLIEFLEKRWLAKSTGFYSILVDRICPSFGLCVQVHPETTNSYARDPWNKCSRTYTNRIEEWKHSLPQPYEFPLILTRPAPLNDYLPCLIEGPALFSEGFFDCGSRRFEPNENNKNLRKTTQDQERIEKAFLKTKKNNSHLIVDMSPLLCSQGPNWSQTWDSYQTQLLQTCKKLHLNPSKVICVQSLQQEGIGGIRLLPFSHLSKKEIDEQYQYLLHWISKFGLCANRVELDRCSKPPSKTTKADTILLLPHISQEAFLTYLNTFDESWNSPSLEKTLMVKGTVNVLKGLMAQLPQDAWEKLIAHPTRSSVVQLSFSKIKELFEDLKEKQREASFYYTASQLEQIHAHLTALLEIFSPYTFQDFSSIYQSALNSIPKQLHPLTSYAIHSSGMTSLAGIYKTVEKSIGKSPRILYGNNAYFENIHTAQLISEASSLETATGADFESVDLILAQFNPILRRIDFEVTEYKVEEIEERLHQIFKSRSNKPLTLAIDCTLDFIDSIRLGNLLTEFQGEIEQGRLNVIAYRSGLKFDLFGMDNYCGAPLYMIHSPDPHWIAFDSLITDPLLQTDRLSLNWFCLAYQNARQELELYRKLVFDNTRSLLDQVPKRLFNMTDNLNYRIVPIATEADAAFIDIKIMGPFHEIKGSLIGGFLTLKCMEKSHPLFYRPSLGFYHPNLSILFSEKCTTIRLTLGLDPTQVDVFVDCFKTIDTLNGKPSKLPFLHPLLMHK
ncbi:MAG: hypothetical protein K2P51_04280 [Rhabdochlamydiaceae bacterium]|nr:hypothetical protein [Rhabdochlamydiaceae bacterium]